MSHDGFFQFSAFRLEVFFCCGSWQSFFFICWHGSLSGWYEVCGDGGNLGFSHGFAVYLASFSVFWGKVKHILNWEKPAGHFPLDSSDLVFLSGDSRARHTHRWQRVSWPRILCVPKLVKYTVKVLCRCRFGMAENRLKWRDDYWGRHGEPRWNSVGLVWISN